MQLVEECQRLSLLLDQTLKPISSQYPEDYKVYCELSLKITSLANNRKEYTLAVPSNISDSRGRFHSQQGRMVFSNNSSSPGRSLLDSNTSVKPRLPSSMMDNISLTQIRMPATLPEDLFEIKSEEVKEKMPPMFPSPIIFQNYSNGLTEKSNVVETRWLMTRNDLTLGKVLGSGASCTVYKGKYKKTPVAIKMMRDTFLGQSLQKEFEREVTAMLRLRHPNLVLFMGACAEPQMIIVLEFCGGDTLFKLLHEKKNIMLN